MSMKTFDIEITETLQTVVYIEADSLEDALSIANNQYRDGDIILDGYSNSNCDVEIKPFKP